MSTRVNSHETGKYDLLIMLQYVDMKEKIDYTNNNVSANYHVQTVIVATMKTGNIPEDEVLRHRQSSCFVLLQSAFSKSSRGLCSKHRTDR